MITKPNYSDAPDFCPYFFDLVEENDLIAALKNSQNNTIELLKAVVLEKEDFRYSPEKWSIKQVVAHIIDCERLYSYRAFRFSRFDATELAGYDQNFYAQNSKAENRTLKEITKEFISVRNSTVSLFEYMNDEMLDFKGIANNYSWTARGLGFMAVGHNMHHCKIIKNKYLD